MHGAEAVATVRAGGFIAAIEPTPSELPEGTVIEQEPPAGARLEREAVITLRLAIALFDVTQAATETDEAPASGQTARTVDPDDTEEWFAALALGGRDARRGGASGRRRRKHRRPRPSARELLFDLPPAPSVGPRAPAGAVPPLERTRGRVNVRPLVAAAICAFPPSLAGLPWRRASAIVAGLLLFVLLGMRLFASSDRRAQSTDHRALARTTHAQVAAQRRAGRNLPVPRRAFHSARKPGARHSRPRGARHRARARKANAAPLATVADQHAHQSQAGDAPATTTARSANGQFAYLGQ
jgi:hypothetical protein